ncbi:MAG: hypothetical protein F4Z50_10240 [Gemmatimonadetes bacterium]|nr:hypothetical protein [Gemmatimonadota bacterium]MYD12860.1 hypothetical protein [Gemmatimonadota bacterium]
MRRAEERGDAARVMQGRDVTPDAGSVPLLRALHQRVFAAPEVRVLLDAAFEELVGELRERREPPHAARVIPIELFTDGLGSALADKVRLCRAFLLRRGRRMAVPEVHRNSVQRLVSYRGWGRIHAESPVEGRSRRGPRDLAARAIHSPDRGDPRPFPIEHSWDIVPAGVWHYPEAGGGADWATVTFHSASEDEIIDEYWEGE